MDQQYATEKEQHTKAQRKALDLIIKKEKEIKNIKNEITKILKENDLNNLDIENHKQKQRVEKL